MKSFFLIIALTILGYTTNSFALSATTTSENNKNTLMQTIDGAFVFPTEKQAVKVRISVNPRSLAAGEKSIAEIMKKMTVVACAAGQCKFTEPNSGLGFFETQFTFLSSLQPKQSFPLLVVACSHLGCTKTTLNVSITEPST